MNKKSMYFGLRLMTKNMNLIDTKFMNLECVIVWIIYFQNENKNTVFSEELITDFFDQIPCKLAADCDVFSIFGKVTIVCCRNALYHFFYKEDFQYDKLDDKLDDECFGWVMTCCIYHLLKKLSAFTYLCSNCQFNFVKSITTRFIKIKND